MKIYTYFSEVPSSIKLVKKTSSTDAYLAKGIIVISKQVEIMIYLYLISVDMILDVCKYNISTFIIIFRPTKYTSMIIIGFRDFGVCLFYCIIYVITNFTFN